MFRWNSLEQQQALPIEACHVRVESRHARTVPDLAAKGRTLAAKRGADIAMALLLIAVLAPLAVLIAIAIKAGSRGPVIYSHERVGRNGRIFACLKFRTMFADAESQLPLLLASGDNAREWRDAQKLRRDPRVTVAGRLLRATSLDELPQLVNILRGDMSFVGPRPVTLGELERYGPDAIWYLSFRPGLTGIWQVSGRSLLPFEARVRLDTDYVRNWSLAADAQVLAKTPWAVLNRRGAY